MSAMAAAAGDSGLMAWAERSGRRDFFDLVAAESLRTWRTHRDRVIAFPRKRLVQDFTRHFGRTWTSGPHQAPAGVSTAPERELLRTYRDAAELGRFLTAQVAAVVTRAGPHKGSHTAVAISESEETLDKLREI